ncbi:MAG: DegT/DnrJ/EryC1/StrS family aminotransferase [Polyangiaceae bacterium]|nr:DegT/DnrJ/EryC1/StrS family aminotransferase [Polyangiaceae bacterium]
MTKLARDGGPKVRERPFPRRRTMGDAEKKAAHDVIDSDDLSTFLGGPGPYFWGGERVRAFERAWAERFGYRHAVSVNSWTSGLYAALGAVGLGPGDEVLCTPYSMSATATTILLWGALPVFGDVDPRTFNLDPSKLEALITPRTRAIMVAHIFGLPADMDGIAAVAKKHGLRVIEDGAQSPMATYRGRNVGGLVDLGGFSLNYHKHVHTGEGGVIVTDDEDLAKRCALIRNHGENVAETIGVTDGINVLGHNLRLTELQAAIGLAQLERVSGYVARRQELAAYFARGLARFPFLSAPHVPEGSTHAYYVYPVLFDEQGFGAPRRAFVEAVNAELPTPEIPEQTVFSEGYVRPLYWNDLYQRRRAIGRGGFPFDLAPEGWPRYARGECPVVERLHLSQMLVSSLVREPLEEADLDDVLRAIDKVASARASLAR